MTEISKVKVLKANTKYYLGQTIKENGIEKPYSRVSRDMGNKEQAKDALKEYQDNQSKRQNKIERTLGVEHGINFKETKKDQYLVALDENKKGLPIVMQIPPIEKGKEAQIFIEGKLIGNAIDVLDSGVYKVMRAVPEIDRIHSNLNRETIRENATKLIIGSVDVENKLVSAKQFDMTKKVDPERNRFIENAVTYFQKCVLMTKDEFERSKIVGEEVSVSKERPNLGRKLEPSLELER